MTGGSIFTPGQALKSSDPQKLGDGVHIHNGQLISSLAGPLTPAQTSIARLSGPLLPQVSTIVLGKITRTLARQATISILALQQTLNSPPTTLKEPLPAVIRQQDIRLTEVDKVKVGEMFRVGDIVRAVVISLGDERSYYCSTAKNELGVLMATNEATANAMVPVSWMEFMDPETGAREIRKVAKVV